MMGKMTARELREFKFMKKIKEKDHIMIENATNRQQRRQLERKLLK